jgi:hypothetical protein
MKNIFQTLRTLSELMTKEMVAKVGKFAVEQLASEHEGKQYNGVVTDKNGQVIFEVIILPKTPEAVLGFGELLTEPKEFKIGTNTVEFRLVYQENGNV